VLNIILTTHFEFLRTIFWQEKNFPQPKILGKGEGEAGNGHRTTSRQLGKINCRQRTNQSVQNVHDSMHTYDSVLQWSSTRMGK